MKRVLGVLCGVKSERPVPSNEWFGWLWVDEDENMLYRCDGTKWIALDGKKSG